MCGGYAIDTEFDAVALGKMEEAADVVILVVRRKKAFGFSGRELKRGKSSGLAELAG